MLKVRAHTCYLGKTGYAAHSRSFFRELSKHVDLRVRNFTWDEDPEYINEIDLSVIDKITLSTPEGMSDFPISHSFPQYKWKKLNDNFNSDIDIVLVESGHYYFYETYKAKIKIAYTVWESTEIDSNFFNQLLKFDYLWVVSEWHRQVAIKQGYPAHRIHVVNEGVNEDCFYDAPVKDPNELEEINGENFNYVFFGRWDYRKSVPEIIEAFLNAFPNGEKVNLILSADNPYSIDGMNTTEERLESHGFIDNRIKVKHFLSREDYISYLRGSDVLISCARSEGWNIPLIEGLVAGIPVIYSEWGAQLEFAKGMGTPVKVEKELPASIGANLGYDRYTPGMYGEPDYLDLQHKIRECYDNWKTKKENALANAIVIREKYNWEKIGISGFTALKNIDLNVLPTVDSGQKTEYNIHFVGGPFVEIIGPDNGVEFKVEFIDRASGKSIHTSIIEHNMWTRPSRKYYTEWLIKITNLTTKKTKLYNFDPRGKKIMISIDSSSLGDSLAWFAPVSNFLKKHDCKLVVSTFKNDLFELQYPEIQFVKPGSVVNDLYASYNIGWFYDSSGNIDYNKTPKNFRMEPLQKASSDILGLDYIPIKPRLKKDVGERPIDEPYVCFGIHSTAQAKYWNNPTGWQELADYYKKKGKKIVVLSNEGDGYMGNYYPTGVMTVEGEKTLENAMRYLKYCDMFIGVSSGLSWLSWAMKKPTVIISGFSWPLTEIIDDNIIRVFKIVGCTGCSNRHKLDPSDWNWCPDQKGTERQFECSKLISASDVILKIENYEIGNKIKTTEDIIQESYELGMVQNHKEIYNAAEFIKNLRIKSFIEIGTDQGGTFAIWSKLSQEDAIKISVDLPHGNFGRSDYNLSDRDFYLNSLGNNIHIIHGDSHLEETKIKVSDILDGEMVDFLFIDGDHRYEGVKLDYLMYTQFVKPGGWIGFHDIKDTEFHRRANCRVDILWEELVGNKIEFIDHSSEFGGIGFIQKKFIQNKIK